MFDLIYSQNLASKNLSSSKLDYLTPAKHILASGYFTVTAKLDAYTAPTAYKTTKDLFELAVVLEDKIILETCIAKLDIHNQSQTLGSYLLKAITENKEQAIALLLLFWTAVGGSVRSTGCSDQQGAGHFA